MTVFLILLALFLIFLGLAFLSYCWRMTLALESAAQSANTQVQLSKEVNQMQAEILRLNHIMTAASQHGTAKPSAN